MMANVPLILADRDETSLAIFIVLVVLSLLWRIARKAMEKRPAPRRPPPRPPAWPVPPAPPVDQVGYVPPPPPPPPTTRRRPSIPVGRPDAPPPVQPVPQPDIRSELRVRLHKLAAKIGQQKTHLANLESQQQQLLDLLNAAPPVPDAEEERTASTVADVQPTVSPAAPPALPPPVVSLTGRDELRLAMLYHEILSPPIGLRERQAGWEVA